MATRKCRNIYFPKYFMSVRKSTNIYHIPNFFVLMLILIVSSRINYASFASYVIAPLLLHEKKLRTD